MAWLSMTWPRRSCSSALACKSISQSCELCAASNHSSFSCGTASRSDKDQLVEEEDDELKEVLDLRKIAVQLLQQEQQNRCVLLFFFPLFNGRSGRLWLHRLKRPLLPVWFS